MFSPRFLDLPALLGGTLLQAPADAAAIVQHLLLDSRRIGPAAGAVFIALRGPRHDAHRYLPAAYAAGVRLLVVEAGQELPGGLAAYAGAGVLAVAQPLAALQALAAARRAAFGGPVLAITGSNGKTVVKEWLAQLLAPDEAVCRSPRSYNSQVGVPLSVWELTPDRHTLGIFEAGISEVGEMARLAAIIQPTEGIFTMLGPAHDAGFGSAGEKLAEKLKLFEGPGFRRLFYCADQPDVYAAVAARQLPGFGWSEHGHPAAAVQFALAEAGPTAPTTIRASYAGAEFAFTAAVPDAASRQNLLHCLAVLLARQVPPAEIQRRVAQLHPVAMRLEMKPGRHGAYLLDDTYNNDLAGLALALDALARQARPGPRTVILSDVLETGLPPAVLYAHVAALLAGAGVTRLVAVGPAISAAVECAATANNPVMGYAREAVTSGIAPDLPDVPPDLPDVPPDLPDVAPDLPDVAPDLPDVAPDLPDVAPDLPDVPENWPDVSANQPDVPVNKPDVALNLPEVALNQPGIPPNLPDVPPQGATQLAKGAARVAVAATQPAEAAGRGGVAWPWVEAHPSTEALLAALDPAGFANQTVLIKGARPFGFERVVAALQAQQHGTVLEVNLDSLTHNLNYYRQRLTPGTKIMVMVKAFAYGAGSYEVARLLEFQRVDYLAVAYADEGIALREAGIGLPILVMNPDPDSLPLLARYRLEPEIYSFELLDEYLAMGNAPLPFGPQRSTPDTQHPNTQKQATSNKKQATIPFHLKLDTGMRRLGFAETDLPQLLAALGKHPALPVASLMTHLAAAETAAHDDFTRHQLAAFGRMAAALETALGRPVLQHALNSAGILRFPEAHLGMVRLGIGLYGGEADGLDPAALQPVSSLRTTVSQVKTLPAGATVGYGRRGAATATERRIATLAIGYADGYDRRFGHGVGTVRLHGQEVPVVGAVCMDMCMVDVTAIPTVRPGDVALVFGPGLPLVELAGRIGTIAYELLTNVSERVKRVFVSE